LKYFLLLQIFLRSKVISGSERSFYQNKSLFDSTFKGAIVRSSSQIMPKFRVCREVFVSVPVVIYTKKDFYLLDVINEKIEDLKASGLIEYWLLIAMNRKVKEKDLNEPKVLSIQRLIGCFQILLFGYFLSLFVFIVEKVVA
jgi:hypothetical protein